MLTAEALVLELRQLPHAARVDAGRAAYRTLAETWGAYVLDGGATVAMMRAALADGLRAITADLVITVAEVLGCQTAA